MHRNSHHQRSSNIVLRQQSSCGHRHVASQRELEVLCFAGMGVGPSPGGYDQHLGGYQQDQDGFSRQPSGHDAQQQPSAFDSQQHGRYGGLQQGGQALQHGNNGPPLYGAHGPPAGSNVPPSPSGYDAVGLASPGGAHFAGGMPPAGGYGDGGLPSAPSFTRSVSVASSADQQPMVGIRLWGFGSAFKLRSCWSRSSHRCACCHVVVQSHCQPAIASLCVVADPPPPPPPRRHVVDSSICGRCKQVPPCMQGHALAPRYPAGCRVLYDAFDQDQPVQGTVAKVDWQGASCTSPHTLLEWRRVQHRLHAASPDL